jgi:hypothetical protein
MHRMLHVLISTYTYASVMWILIHLEHRLTEADTSDLSPIFCMVCMQGHAPVAEVCVSVCVRVCVCAQNKAHLCAVLDRCPGARVQAPNPSSPSCMSLHVRRPITCALFYASFSFFGPQLRRYAHLIPGRGTCNYHCINPVALQSIRRKMFPDL